MDVRAHNARPGLQEARSYLRAYFRLNERLFVNISARRILTNFRNKTQSGRVLILFSGAEREECNVPVLASVSESRNLRGSECVEISKSAPVRWK